MLIAFHKPFGVLSQFTSESGKPTLADFIDMPGIYAAGRLDFDSEGLLLLTDDGALQHDITDPERRLVKRYWAQVEGIPEDEGLDRFGDGLWVGTGADRYRALPAEARRIDDPAMPARTPPIRVRASIPTCWIEISIREGRNRQVRRMTAAIGHPTLRLLRVGVGSVDLMKLRLAPGMSVAIEGDRLRVASKRHKSQTASE